MHFGSLRQCSGGGSPVGVPPLRPSVSRLCVIGRVPIIGSPMAEPPKAGAGLSFELMGHAFRAGGFDSTSIGFLGGAAVYTAANFTFRGAAQSIASGPGKMLTQGPLAPTRVLRLPLGRCSTAFPNRS